MIMRPSVLPTAAFVALLMLSSSAAQEPEPSTTPPAPPAPASPAAAPAAAAAPPTHEEVDTLRREIDVLRRRIAELEARLSLLSSAASSPAGATPAAPTAAAPTPPEVPLRPAATAPPARSQSLLNPAISAILQLNGTTSLVHSSDANGFDLSEAEIALQSVVDPYAKFDMFLTFPSSGSPAVEEGTVTTLALPASLQLKGGRFKSAFGKWNTLHDHAFFTIERPDALVNFFGEESLTNDGLSLSVLIPNPWDQFINSITEVGTALPGTSFNADHSDLTWLEHLAWFFNTTPNSTLEAGLTATRGKAGISQALIAAIQRAGVFTGLPRDRFDSSVYGLDLTFKWKPLRLNVYRSFLWQTEVLHSRRDLEVLVQPALTLAPATVSSYGGYSYLEWQFAKRWRAGARYDLSELPDEEAAREWATAAVVRYQPTEFQEVRFEIKRSVRNAAAALRFNGEPDDTQLFFEWIPVIGAHGAHPY